jgi:hypothetical protein
MSPGRGQSQQPAVGGEVAHEWFHPSTWKVRQQLQRADDRSVTRSKTSAAMVPHPILMPLSCCALPQPALQDVEYLNIESLLMENMLVQRYA